MPIIISKCIFDTHIQPVGQNHIELDQNTLLALQEM